MTQSNLAEQVQNKLVMEEQEIRKRSDILRGLNTKDIVALIPKLEESLEQAMRDDAGERSLNTGYLASQGSDCSEVKRILAELTTSAEGKNATEREAWLTKQRTSNGELVAALNRQANTAFQLENNRITIEMARKKLENMRAILALKTAQIEFLTIR